MKMSIGEKKILFVFGCPNREATVDRLYQVADLIPDPAGKKVVEALANITHLHCIVHSIPMECCYMQAS